MYLKHVIQVLKSCFFVLSKGFLWRNKGRSKPYLPAMQGKFKAARTER